MSEPRKTPRSILSPSPGAKETDIGGSQSAAAQNALTPPEQVDVQPAATTTTPSPSAAADDAGFPKPEHLPLSEIPEQFRTPDGKIKWADLAKSYVHLRQRLSKREEELKNAIRAEMVNAAEEIARDPDAYYALPENSPFSVDDKVDASFLGSVRSVLASYGVSREDWTKLVEAFAGWQTAREPDPEQEIAALGERAKERIAAVRDFLSANLQADEFEALVGSVRTARAFRALERLVERAAGVRADAEQVRPQAARPLSEAEVYRMMADPRYWQHTREGQELRRAVAEWFAQRTRSG